MKKTNEAVEEMKQIILEKMTYQEVEKAMMTSDRRKILPEKLTKELYEYHRKVIYDPEYTEEARTVVHAIYGAYMRGELFTRMGIEAIGITNRWLKFTVKRTLEG